MAPSRLTSAGNRLEKPPGRPGGFSICALTIIPIRKVSRGIEVPKDTSALGVKKWPGSGGDILDDASGHAGSRGRKETAAE